MRGLTAPLAPQVGGGRYKPRVLVPPGKSAAMLQGGLAVEHFDYAPALAEHIAGCATFPPRLLATPQDSAAWPEGDSSPVLGRALDETRAPAWS